MHWHSSVSRKGQEDVGNSVFPSGFFTKYETFWLKETIQKSGKCAATVGNVWESAAGTTNSWQNKQCQAVADDSVINSCQLFEQRSFFHPSLARPLGGEGFLTWFWVHFSAWSLYKTVWRADFRGQRLELEVRSKELGLRWGRGSFWRGLRALLGFSPWSSLTPHHNLCLQLQEQRCASVTLSLTRLAQVNDLQPLKTAASWLVVTPAASLVPLSLYSLSLHPAWLVKSMCAPLRRYGVNLLDALPGGCDLFVPLCLLNGKLPCFSHRVQCPRSSFPANIWNAGTWQAHPASQNVDLGGKSFLKLAGASELWFKLVTVTRVLTDG